jgi:rod shape-determining protein MreD
VTRTSALSLRLAVLGLLCVVLQIVAVSQIDLLGTNADLLPLTVAAVGLMCGPVEGAIFGFATGLLTDAALVEVLGPTCLVATVVGYAAGRLGDRLDDTRGPLLALAVGAAATSAAQVGYAGLQFLLGNDAPVSWLLLRQVVATILVNTLIALFVFAFVRRVIWNVVPDGRRSRRRRYAASLSPLHRA